MRTTITRLIRFSAAHRLVGHEGKCRHLHGHNYRVELSVAPRSELDDVGRVVDFDVIDETVGKWVDDNLDHRLLLWEEDPMTSLVVSRSQLDDMHDRGEGDAAHDVEADLDWSIVPVPFNPTAENLARFLVDVAQHELDRVGAGVDVINARVWETDKAFADAGG